MEGTTVHGFNIVALKYKNPCPIFEETGGIEALLYVEESRVPK